MDRKYLHIKVTSDILALILFLGLLALPAASLGLASFSGTGSGTPSVAGVEDINENMLEDNDVPESTQATQSSQT